MQQNNENKSKANSSVSLQARLKRVWLRKEVLLLTKYYEYYTLDNLHSFAYYVYSVNFLWTRKNQHISYKDQLLERDEFHFRSGKFARV